MHGPTRINQHGDVNNVHMVDGTTTFRNSSFRTEASSAYAVRIGEYEVLSSNDYLLGERRSTAAAAAAEYQQ